MSRVPTMAQSEKGQGLSRGHKLMWPPKILLGYLYDPQDRVNLIEFTEPGAVDPNRVCVEKAGLRIFPDRITFDKKLYSTFFKESQITLASHFQAASQEQGYMVSVKEWANPNQQRETLRLRLRCKRPKCSFQFQLNWDRKEAHWYISRRGKGKFMHSCCDAHRGGNEGKSAEASVKVVPEPQTMQPTKRSFLPVSTVPPAVKTVLPPALQPTSSEEILRMCIQGSSALRAKLGLAAVQVNPAIHTSLLAKRGEHPWEEAGALHQSKKRKIGEDSVLPLSEMGIRNLQATQPLAGPASLTHAASLALAEQNIGQVHGGGAQSTQPRDQHTATKKEANEGDIATSLLELSKNAPSSDDDKKKQSEKHSGSDNSESADEDDGGDKGSLKDGRGTHETAGTPSMLQNSAGGAKSIRVLNSTRAYADLIKALPKELTSQIWDSGVAFKIRIDSQGFIFEPCKEGSNNETTDPVADILPNLRNIPPVSYMMRQPGGLSSAQHYLLQSTSPAAAALSAPSLFAGSGALPSLSARHMAAVANFPTSATASTPAALLSALAASGLPEDSLPSLLYNPSLHL